MKVLLLKTWLTNIGNGFIDKGARVAIEQAFPDAEIVEASGYPNYYSDHKQAGPVRGAGNVLGPVGEQFEELLRDDTDATQPLLNIAELVDVDVAVFPGCVLYEYALRKYLPTLESLTERDIPIVFLGVGGVDYEPETVQYVTDVFDSVDTAGLITRDTDAYDAYADQFEMAYSGIDCGFFVSDWYEPPNADAEFLLSTFDKVEEPTFRTNKQIVRPTHVPFGDVSPVVGMAKQFVPSVAHRGPRDLLREENAFLSDSLEDYLFLYANGHQTHSDRIHACVPALAFGNEARFYYSTPRAGLFDQLLDGDITAETVTVSQEQLESKKQAQIDQLREIVVERVSTRA